MELKDYQFPSVTPLDMAFPTLDAPPKLVSLAKERGFYNGNTPANDLFSKWFFGGLEKTPDFKEGIDETKAQRAMNWAVCLLRSFTPKHEEKEAVCALIFDEYLTLKTN